MQTRLPRVRLIGIVTALSLVATLAVVGPAQASQPPRVTVNVVDCMGGSGTVEVAAGAPLLLEAGWAALTPLHELEFFISQRTVASINGAPIRLASLYWRPPQKTYPFPDLPWNMSWDYPVHALKHGQSITVAYEWYLRFPVSDGVDTYPSGPVLAPFGYLPSCTITAD